LGRLRIRDDHQKARSGWGGEQGDEEDKEDFMVEEMRRPGSAGGWAAASAAESPEKQERSRRERGACLFGESFHGSRLDDFNPCEMNGIGVE
jgi:hypothetical protein